MGKNVVGKNVLRGNLSVGKNVVGKIVWGKMSWGKLSLGEKCYRAIMAIEILVLTSWISHPGILEHESCLALVLVTCVHRT